jgi:hypothetical protein
MSAPAATPCCKLLPHLLDTISHHELSFWVAASAQRALAATIPSSH